jgi:5-methylcytosine-specific restriction protein A
VKRFEFSKDVKRAALRRSHGRCEGKGATYGFARGVRCNANLAFGVEYDHFPIRAADGGFGELGNCAAVCIKCHRWKTSKIDLPQIAKSKRLFNRQWNIVDHHNPIPGSSRSGFKRTLNGDTRTRVRGAR